MPHGFCQVHCLSEALALWSATDVLPQSHWQKFLFMCIWFVFSLNLLTLFLTQPSGMLSRIPGHLSQSFDFFSGLLKIIHMFYSHSDTLKNGSKFASNFAARRTENILLELKHFFGSRKEIENWRRHKRWRLSWCEWWRKKKSWDSRKRWWDLYTYKVRKGNIRLFFRDSQLFFFQKKMFYVPKINYFVVSNS